MESWKNWRWAEEEERAGICAARVSGLLSIWLEPVNADENGSLMISEVQ